MPNFDGNISLRFVGVSIPRCYCWISTCNHSIYSCINIPQYYIGRTDLSDVSERWCKPCWERFIREISYSRDFEIKKIASDFAPPPSIYKDRIEGLRKKLSLEL